jgi:hypothetical protein
MVKGAAWFRLWEAAGTLSGASPTPEAKDTRKTLTKGTREKETGKTRTGE